MSFTTKQLELFWFALLLLRVVGGISIIVMAVNWLNSIENPTERGLGYVAVAIAFHSLRGVKGGNTHSFQIYPEHCRQP